MKHMRTMSVALCFLTLAGAGIAQEHKIQRSQLPEVAEKTLETQTKGSQITGFAEEKENGKTYYEAKTMMKGHSRTVQVDPEGALTEIEEQVVLSSLPAGVQTGLKAKAGRGKITKVESLTKHDQLVAYEAQVMTAGKHSEIQVGPTGEPLDHEE